MDKKRISLISVYALVMVGLFIATFGGQWNPSNYSYTMNEDTVVIEKGLFSEKVEAVDIDEHINNILLFQVALSEERQLWRLDVGMIGLMLPLLAFLFIPQQRPLKKYLSFKWYMTVVLAILVLYMAYSIPNHLTQIENVHEYVRILVE
ncbi:hypothetical protein [Halobacillus litoralis]|uniref:hypothetical protein n=1 Tax=Halobacillus litoralis TaxID=45668 RepID=UPI001CFE0E69|nr:hypothetical protein [Halobacillus litoralis]